MGYPLQRRGRTELNYMKGPDNGIHPLANGGGRAQDVAEGGRLRAHRFCPQVLQ